MRGTPMKDYNAFDLQTSGKLLLRRLLSNVSHTGVVPPPSMFRPYGISALMTGKNEEDWVETSLLSIVNFVDEVVVADHGSEDDTAEIMERVSNRFPNKIRVWRYGDQTFPDVLNALMAQSRYQW